MKFIGPVRKFHETANSLMVIRVFKLLVTAFGPYALNVRTNISSYGPRARLMRVYYC